MGSDFFDPEDACELANGGNRQATMLIYLSSLAQADGGATHFPRAKLSVQPRCGDALLWWNTRCDGRVDPSSAHAGEVVLSSTSKWVHCPSGCVNGPSRWTLAAPTPRAKQRLVAP